MTAGIMAISKAATGEASASLNERIRAFMRARFCPLRSQVSMDHRRVDENAIPWPARRACCRAVDDLRRASRAPWQCVLQNTLYPAIPCTVEKALDLPCLGTSDRFGILLHRDLAQ